MKVLGIESSCDNSCMCLIDSQKKILFSFNINQDDVAKEIGGYAPLIVSDNHISAFTYIIRTISIELVNSVDYIAVTTGPGIALCLTIGIHLAKLMSVMHNKPLFFVDHIEGHILSNFIDNDLSFPYISVTMSGGHFIVCLVYDIGQYQLISCTVDDAPGEVIDKIARKLNLEQFNGIYLENEAFGGKLISSIVNTNIKVEINSNFMSFSGIKTKFIRAIDSKQFNSKDIAFTLQYNIFHYIVKRIILIAKKFKIKNICFNGGVSANKYFRSILPEEFNYYFTKYSADNAEMISIVCVKYIEKYGNKYNKSNLVRGEIAYDALDYNKFIK